MAKNPRNPAEQPETDSNIPAIMTKPLPVILDELESYIKRVEEAVKVAQSAARDSRAAAAEAKESGEKAAEAAKKAAEAAVAKVKEEAIKRAEALDARIDEVTESLASLEDKVKQEVIALDDAFLALKDRHMEQSPFFSKR
jgi:hypothetical protein